VVKPPPPSAEEEDRTVFEPAPAPLKRAREISHTTASELVIDEPEPASDAIERTPPRPKNRRGGGGGGGRSVSDLLKWVAVAALVGAAGFSVYYFVWPLVGGGRSDGSAGAAVTPTTSSARSTTSSAPSDSTATSPLAVTTSSPSDPRSSAGAATPPAPATTSTPPVTAPSNSGAPKPPASSATRTAGSGEARSLLQSGNIAAAARAFQKEISTTGADKFTLALGLYCNEENAGRLVAGAGGSGEIFVLPTSVEGRNCIRVMWGLYDSREAAERGIASLPNGVRAGDVAPVAVARFLR
jgi:hypothetical protein